MKAPRLPAFAVVKGLVKLHKAGALDADQLRTLTQMYFEGPLRAQLVKAREILVPDVSKGAR